jgi:hypothetical protein
VLASSGQVYSRTTAFWQFTICLLLGLGFRLVK